MTSLFQSKRDLILKIAGEYKCRNFVETGTGGGDMLAEVYPYFKSVQSIELSKELFDGACKRFDGVENVSLWSGDSGDLLQSIALDLKGRTLYFLDAHYSGGNTVRGKLETPVLAELQAIILLSGHEYVVLIDDVDSFIANPEYPTIDTVISYVHSLEPNAHINVIPDGGGMILITSDTLKLYPRNTLKPIYVKESPAAAAAQVADWSLVFPTHAPHKQSGRQSVGQSLQSKRKVV